MSTAERQKLFGSIERKVPIFQAGWGTISLTWHWDTEFMYLIDSDRGVFIGKISRYEYITSSHRFRGAIELINNLVSPYSDLLGMWLGKTKSAVWC